MPFWRFYDDAAERVRVYGGGGDWTKQLNSAWLKPTYVFNPSIPSYDLTLLVDAFTAERTWPDEQYNPWYHTPRYPEDDPDVLRRGKVAPQAWDLPCRARKEESAEHSLMGESQWWHDTWNREFLWRSPHAYWTPPLPDYLGYVFPPVQHLIIYIENADEPPIGLLTLDSPISYGTKYEFDFAGGPFNVPEARYGVIWKLVEA